MKKKQKPKFKIPNLGVKKRVKDRWRKPRGIDNKKRIRKKSAGPSPNIGYKNSEKIRGLHPCGKREVLISNEKELDGIDPDKYVVRIRGSVGKRKRELIVKKAKELKIRVLNGGVVNAKG